MTQKLFKAANMDFLCNQKLNQEQEEVLLRSIAEGETLLFAVFGNLSLTARYQPLVLLGTDACLYTLDLTEHELQNSIAYSDLERLYAKRMYGNGILRAELKNGDTIDLFRYTFGVAGICDAVVAFCKDYHAGQTLAEAMEQLQGAYQKALSVCPNCGRTLPTPGSPCVGCMKKTKLLAKLARFVKPEAGMLLLSVVFSVITSTLSLAPPRLTQTLVDDILPNRNLELLVRVVFLIVGIYLIRYTISGFRAYFLRATGDRIMAHIRTEVYEKAQYLPMQFYDKTSTGGVVNRIGGDTSTLQTYMLKVTQEVFVQFFRALSIIVIMFLTNWKLALFSLAPVPIAVVAERVFRKKIRPFYRRIWRRSAAVTGHLTDTIPGIRVVKAFVGEKRATERFAESVEDWRETDTRAGKIMAVYPAVINTLMCCGSVVIWYMGGNMVISGTKGITIGLLVSFITYATMFYEPVNFFANLAESHQGAMAAAERIMDILEAEPEHDFGKGNTDADMGGRIEFKNVNFAFDRTKRVLKDINLTIEPGDVVGIVGTTGSGKTTMVNLLLRYYDHYEGTITVGGQDIRDIDMEYYRSQIGFVQQEPIMFHDTIYKNLAYGNPQTPIERVIEAADVANAHEFILRQPDGYDSVLGERGVGLSGGERQRISIARAVLQDPKILIFDEATASVDSETEHLIQDAIENLISGRTTIMIAHRLSTLSKANKIVVVEKGRIIECGTQEELLAAKGKFYRLVQIQTMNGKGLADEEVEE